MLSEGPEKSSNWGFFFFSERNEEKRRERKRNKKNSLSLFVFLFTVLGQKKERRALDDPSPPSPLSIYLSLLHSTTASGGVSLL